MRRSSGDCFTITILALGLISYTVTKGDFRPVLVIFGIFLLIYLFNSSKKAEQTLTQKEKLQNVVVKPKRTCFLTNISLSGELLDISEDIKRVNSLEKINLITNRKIEISFIIKNNPNLKEISLSGPFYFSEEISCAVNLKVIRIDNNNVDFFLRKIGLSFDKKLILDNITGFIDDDLNYIRELSSLSISNTILSRPDFSNFKNLKYLQLKNNKINQFPYSVFTLQDLEFLSLETNKIREISNKKIVVNSSNKLRTIILSNNLLRNIPQEIFNLPSIDKVYVWDNNFSKLRLRSLKRRFADRISFDYKQEAIRKRILSPITWKIIRLIITVFMGLVPYLFFDSVLFSCLLSFYIFFLGGINFLFRKS